MKLRPKCVVCQHDQTWNTTTVRPHTPHRQILTSQPASQPASLASDVFKGVCACMFKGEGCTSPCCLPGRDPWGKYTAGWITIFKSHTIKGQSELSQHTIPGLYEGKQSPQLHIIILLSLSVLYYMYTAVCNDLSKGWYIWCRWDNIQYRFYTIFIWVFISSVISHRFILWLNGLNL